jgi:hypothetical protein
MWHMKFKGFTLVKLHHGLVTSQSFVFPQFPYFTNHKWVLFV